MSPTSGVVILSWGCGFHSILCPTQKKSALKAVNSRDQTLRFQHLNRLCSDPKSLVPIQYVLFERETKGHTCWVVDALSGLVAFTYLGILRHVQSEVAAAWMAFRRIKWMKSLKDIPFVNLLLCLCK